MYFNKGMMKNMRKNIKGTHKMKGKYTLKKTREKEDYVITSSDIKEMAMQQEGNKILDVLDGLSNILRGKETVQQER